MGEPNTSMIRFHSPITACFSKWSSAMKYFSRVARLSFKSFNFNRSFSAWRLAIVSSTYRFMVTPFAAELGLDAFCGCELESKGGRCMG